MQKRDWVALSSCLLANQYYLRLWYTTYSEVYFSRAYKIYREEDYRIEHRNVRFVSGKQITGKS
jgi:hypothetical protein